MTTEPSDKLRTYRGNCHCGHYVYEAELPEIKSLYDCNCSICTKKGYLGVFVGAADGSFRVLKGTDEDLTSYSFGPKNWLHKFCSTCGTPVLGYSPDGPPDKKRVLNVHSIQDFNTWDLERVPFDGASLGDPYVPHKYKGPLPPEVEGRKTYTGTCHCGKLGLAVSTKPLDETYEGNVIECNCSICERNAYIWIYPEIGSVILSGDEADMGKYKFAKCLTSKTFCRTCGVFMTNENEPELYQLPDTEENRIIKNWLAKAHPLNLRVLDGVDFSKLKKPARIETAKSVLPLYENP
ncbi:hypothetical protein L249_1395 [Ophiocordyceps polyrhachis-furcata BCC 54312]|uniref:CENP-V/GFA domain-containing protein n=1 Tax=Ophiocordyceps polyrhachis-furcata BCC 54312 TaxID=1330021 RepID=A0A367L470_9HYPO|nr:hypothetical protein L249_1395 [Ophiocordyceps polyrhachis-furcata BCC 54312]